MIVVQQTRGTLAQNLAYTGPPGELVVVDSPTWQLYIHDGVTPGGHLVGGAPVSGTGTGGVAGVGSQYVFNSATFTIPAQALKLTLVGGGGGGGGTNGGATPSPASGGAGGAAIANLTGLTIGQTLTIVVGLGGPGGGAANAGGALGGTSMVSSGTAAITTVTAGGGHGAISPTVSGIGGSGTGGALNLQGNGGGTPGGVSSLFPPIGNGGSTSLNGLILNGVTLANQDGVQGVVVVEW